MKQMNFHFYHVCFWASFIVYSKNIKTMTRFCRQFLLIDKLTLVFFFVAIFMCCVLLRGNYTDIESESLRNYGESK